MTLTIKDSESEQMLRVSQLLHNLLALLGSVAPGVSRMDVIGVIERGQGLTNAQKLRSIESDLYVLSCEVDDAIRSKARPVAGVTGPIVGDGMAVA